MGGLFSAPSPSPVQPLPEVKDPSEDERARRLEELDRRRRGRSGTVETGFRGVLSQGQSGAAKTGKTYLGE